MAALNPVLCPAVGAWNDSHWTLTPEKLPQPNPWALISSPSDKLIDFSETAQNQNLLLDGGGLDIRSRIVCIAKLEQEGESGVEELVAKLEDERAAVRCRAARALGRMGTVGVDALSLVVRSRRGRARRAAAEALGHLGEAAEESAAEVVIELSDPDPDVRRQAAETLGSFGMAASKYAEVLSEHLADGDSWVRSSAARALQCMGPEGARALSELLMHSDAEVWCAAARALECMGKVGAAALEALRSDGRDSHPLRISQSLQRMSQGTSEPLDVVAGDPQPATAADDGNVRPTVSLDRQKHFCIPAQL